ncbi:MAG: signal recognition particle-docking protein FtsY [Lachnospiraceae bacterium]|nr:signal recognition particle-docking protein FtsY [Lachnospiraceae bacterium]
MAWWPFGKKKKQEAAENTAAEAYGAEQASEQSTEAQPAAPFAQNEAQPAAPAYSGAEQPAAAPFAQSEAQPAAPAYSGAEQPAAAPFAQSEAQPAAPAYSGAEQPAAAPFAQNEAQPYSAQGFPGADLTGGSAGSAAYAAGGVQQPDTPSVIPGAAQEAAAFRSETQQAAASAQSEEQPAAAPFVQPETPQPPAQPEKPAVKPTLFTKYEEPVAVEEPVQEEVPEEGKKKKKGFFKRLKEGLAKTRDNFVYNLDIIFDGAAAIDDEFYEELEEILVMGDIGVRTTEEILDNLKEQVDKKRIVRPTECKQLLIDNIREQMHVGEAAYLFETRPSVVFVIGVNGVGKTTSIGKIASHLKAQGRHVMMAAADTFRAAAGDQLKIWAERAGVELIGGKEGADPSSVLYDAAGAARARGVDVLLVDTAGRLNNKKNLMEELKKMNRVIDREFPDAYRENLIVLDATTGQNALQQAKDFNDVADLSGIILTKMDGTAKGGIAVAIQSELKIPVKYIGVGEHIEDLQKFDADAFVEALFDVEPEKEEDGDEGNADADT